LSSSLHSYYCSSTFPLQILTFFFFPTLKREFLYPAVTLHPRAWCRFNFGDSPFKYGHTIPLGPQGVNNFNYSPYCESVKVSHPSVRFDPSIQHFLPLPFYGQDNLISWCSSCGSTDSLRELLEGISPSVAFRTTLGYHSTPLHYACQFGQYPVVKFLIEKGIPLHQSSDTATALHTAIFGGHFECFELLMTAGLCSRLLLFCLFAWLFVCLLVCLVLITPFSLFRC
jgi:hypothetical protein